MTRFSPCSSFAIALFALAACQEPTDPAPPRAESATTAVAAVLAFTQLSAGGGFTCAVTAGNLPYCWGDAADGRLGVGTTTVPTDCTSAVGTPFACATRPMRVAGGHAFTRISAGSAHACGVTADFHAWCWGRNTTGALGTGTTVDAAAPKAVAGGLLFRKVEAGSQHTCGITYPDNRVFCWGYNASGQLGDGSLSRRLTPVLVLGNLHLSQITAGEAHTCGITTTGHTFCWGRNTEGQLGDSTTVLRRPRPSEVVGAHVFRQLDAGAHHTCAVTTTDRAFCWGDGRHGELGNGHAFISYWPRAVSGSLSVRRVSAGLFHGCAETLGSVAWCWGSNSYGQLGDGSPQFTQTLKPVRVAGGIAFAQLSAGDWHTCAKTSAGVGYCWGDDFFAALGAGTSGGVATTPVPVAAPM